jgi:capsular exopolysaccharide synthesis family protein
MAANRPEVGQPIVDLRDYLGAIWSRKWQVLGVALGVIFVGTVWTLMQQPIYFAQAKVLVLPPQNPSLSTTTINPSLLTPIMTTEMELVRSDAVSARVNASLTHRVQQSRLLAGLQVAPIPDSNIMLIGYRSLSPDAASSIANAFAREYIEVRTRSRVAGIESGLRPIEEEISSANSRIALLTEKISSGAVPNPGPLKAEREALKRRLPALDEKALELRTAASATKAGEIVQPAREPAAPTSPNRLLNGVVFLLGGLALGLVVALVRDAMDKRVRSREELERRVGAPVLAVVPKVQAWRRSDPPLVISESGLRHPATEAYGTLATNVRYGGSQYLLKVVTVTSALPGEGKTVTVANLSVALAQAGYRVIIVSGDLRRPRIHQFFGVGDGKGLTDAVVGSVSLSDVIVPSAIPTLSLVPTGPLPDNPVAFLARLKTSGILDELRDMSDVVIFDAPPILPVADAAVLASMSDGVVFVHSPSRSSRQAVTASRDRLMVAGAKIVGVVYNNVDIRGRGRYYGAYSGPYLDAGNPNGNR